MARVYLAERSEDKSLQLHVRFIAYSSVTKLKTKTKKKKKLLYYDCSQVQQTSA